MNRSLDTWKSDLVKLRAKREEDITARIAIFKNFIPDDNNLSNNGTRSRLEEGCFEGERISTLQDFFKLRHFGESQSLFRNYFFVIYSLWNHQVLHWRYCIQWDFTEFFCRLLIHLSDTFSELTFSTGYFPSIHSFHSFYVSWHQSSALVL